nr:MAG TPA: hypothetical protein [Caudoviricetes sp.]
MVRKIKSLCLIQMTRKDFFKILIRCWKIVSNGYSLRFDVWNGFTNSRNSSYDSLAKSKRDCSYW